MKNVRDGDSQNLQSLATLLADLESRLAEASDQHQIFGLRQLQQRCLLEIFLLKRTLRHNEEPQ